jgi:hypothetical protein
MALEMDKGFRLAHGLKDSDGRWMMDKQSDGGRHATYTSKVWHDESDAHFCISFDNCFGPVIK